MFNDQGYERQMSQETSANNAGLRGKALSAAT